MLDSLFWDKITVNRSSAVSSNSFGEPNYTSTAIYTNIPARVEGQNANTQYRKSNERGVNFTIIYVPKTYTIFLQDEIIHTQHAGATIAVTLGLVVGINEALAPDGTTDHLEVIIENP